MNKSFVIWPLSILAMSQISFAQDPAKPHKSVTPPVQPPVNQSSHESDRRLTDEAVLLPAAKATAQMQSKSSSKAFGEVRFLETGTGMHGQYKITGLTKEKVNKPQELS